MKRTSWSIVASFIAMALLAPRLAVAGQELPPMGSTQTPAISSAKPDRTTVPRFEKFELSVALSATYDNPFDPEQVNLTAEFVAPSGRRVAVPGFFYQEYRDRTEGDDTKCPVLDAVGDPGWRVRFAPTEVGVYRYTLRLENRIANKKKLVEWGPAEFTCVASKEPGFIRISPVNHRYFQHDDGTSFFVVGQNLQNDWPYYVHYRPLAAAGCNAVRVWTFCHYTWLEWTYKADIPWAKEGHFLRAYAGAGRYNQRIAWVLDHHLSECERNGLRLMLCLGNATGGGELSKEKKESYSSWAGHPYNAANGGFLDAPAKFWTDERARKLYKQRLRYLVARYGYSPGIWAWEFWNELGEARSEIVEWHREMADYLRQQDPNRHLITTSTWQTAEMFNPVWDLGQMDFTQVHNYRSADPIRQTVEQGLRNHPQKPFIVGEGGGSPAHRTPKSEGFRPTRDPQGIEFHNSLWAAALSGSAGTTLPWWWRERVEPDNLFFHYAALTKFAQDVPWNTLQWKPAKRPRVLAGATAGTRNFSPVAIFPLGPQWGKKAPRNRFDVLPDGTVPHIENLSGSLFGRNRSEWRNPPILAVRYPTAGRCTVHVAKASHSELEIVLDGKVALQEKSLHLEKEDGVGKDFSVDVSAGTHEIELRNSGSDHLTIGYVLLANYRDTAEYPDVDIYHVQADDAAYLWVHHRLNIWLFQAAGFSPEPIEGAKAEIAGLADGAYRVQWWDTYRGEVTKTERQTSRSGRLEMNIPTLRTDAAVKIERER